MKALNITIEKPPIVIFRIRVVQLRAHLNVTFSFWLGGGAISSVSAIQPPEIVDELAYDAFEIITVMKQVGRTPYTLNSCLRRLAKRRI